MKYRMEVSINRPRSEVWQAFTDPERLKLWQSSLTGIELMSGTRLIPGAVSKLTFTENKREFVLTETILQCQEPERLDQMYENQFSINTIINSFLEQEHDQTLWVTDTEYRFKTLLMKIMGPVYKKNFIARTHRDMESFKKLLENNSNRN